MAFDRSTWRLICTPPGSGAWNMAVDEAILEAVGRQDAPATLRLYAWHPPCLSLGYAQPVADVDDEALRDHGWELVRRPTGGKAILHTDELTYAVIGPESDERLSGGVLESYLKLSQGLLEALRVLGVEAQAVEHPAKGVANNSFGASNADGGQAVQNPVCFEVPSTYEITVRGHKIIGSAQARRKEGVLQHGSLPLCGDLTRILQALVMPQGLPRHTASERLMSRAITLEAVLGKAVSWEQAAQAFIKGFGQALNLELIEAELSTAEKARAQALVAEKYAHPGWTRRV